LVKKSISQIKIEDQARYLNQVTGAGVKNLVARRLGTFKAFQLKATMCLQKNKISAIFVSKNRVVDKSLDNQWNNCG
jgi:hypothetical protein